MTKIIPSEDILFEIKDIFGRSIRTTKSYWKKIKEIKHTEFHFGIREVKKTITNPSEVRESVTDQTIFLFARELRKYVIIVAIKTLNGEGFIVTVYQTENYKKKGKLLWPEQKEQNQK